MGRPKKSSGTGKAAGKAVGKAAAQADAKPAASAQADGPVEKPRPKSGPKSRPKSPSKATESEKSPASGRRLRPKSEADEVGAGLVSSTLLQSLKMRTESASELARAAGVNPRSVQRFLSGERDLSLAAVDRLAEVLGLRLVVSTRSGRPSRD